MYEWDVFVSHNRQQKPWVRELVLQWRSLGIRVFFDEDNILPGENIVRGIEQGLTRSRHVVLIITPTSMSSKWVAMEVATTIYTDIDANERKLIPVLLEPTDDIRLAIRSLNMIDLTDHTTRVDRYHFLLRSLHVDVTPLPNPPDNNIPVIDKEWSELGKQMLATDKVWKLREILYKTEALLLEHPGDPTGRILKDKIKQAIKKKRHSSLSRIFLSLGLLVAAFVAYYWGIMKTPTKGKAPCEIQITAPSPGENVGSQGEVYGKARIPTGSYLWVLAHLKSPPEDKWWPQGGGAASSDKDGPWEVAVSYGMARGDIGKEFEIAVAVVSEDVNTSLQQWVQRADQTGQYLPIAFPKVINGCPLPKITVKKTSLE
jgi:hypothetical protein